jgi:hypothetical protein
MAYGMAIPEERRFAFTLKLSDEVIVMALKSSRGFAGFMQDRIARFLRNGVPYGGRVDFTFVVEAWGKWERPHLQGGIELPHPFADEDDVFSLRDDRTELIREALIEAGGRTRKSTQLNAKPMYEAAGWFGYLGKRRLVTARTLKRMRKSFGIAPLTKTETLVAATQSLRQAGKRWFENAKATENFVLWDRRKRSSAPSV